MEKAKVVRRVKVVRVDTNSCNQCDLYNKRKKICKWKGTHVPGWGRVCERFINNK